MTQVMLPLSLRHKAFTAVRWTTLATVIRATMQIAQVAVLARLLAHAEFGLMAIVSVIVGFGLALGDPGEIHFLEMLATQPLVRCKLRKPEVLPVRQVEGQT